VQDKSEITSCTDLKRNGPPLDDLNRCYRVHSWPGADPAYLWLLRSPVSLEKKSSGKGQELQWAEQGLEIIFRLQKRDQNPAHSNTMAERFPLALISPQAK